MVSPPPANVLPFMQEASAGTGIPITVVEAQNVEESGYGSNQGPSSAGAIGPWQFEPSTFTGLGFPAGQEWSWSVSTQAYIKYMNQLLQDEHGNLMDALAAYNAGPGNIGAGMGYAQTILSNAGVASGTTVTPGSGTNQTPVGGSVPNTNTGTGTSTTGLFSDPFTAPFEGIIQWMTSSLFAALGIGDLKDLLQRLGLILLGAVLIIVGLNMLAHGNTTISQPQAPSTGNGNGNAESSETSGNASTGKANATRSKSATSSAAKSSGAGASGTGALASEAGEAAVLA